MKIKSLFFIICLFYSFTALAQDKADDTKHVTESVTLEGLIEKPNTFTVSSLQSMNNEKRGTYKITNHEGVLKRKVNSFKGVPLREIIKQAGVKLENPKDRGKFFIVVTASDGYQVIFAYTEIMFNETGNKTFLVYESDCKPLDKEGKIALYTTSDTATGPRHVRWVQK